MGLRPAASYWVAGECTHQDREILYLAISGAPDVSSDVMMRNPRAWRQQQRRQQQRHRQQRRHRQLSTSHLP